MPKKSKPTAGVKTSIYMTHACKAKLQQLLNLYEVKTGMPGAVTPKDVHEKAIDFLWKHEGLDKGAEEDAEWTMIEEAAEKARKERDKGKGKGGGKK